MNFNDQLCSMKLHEVLYSPGPARISILRVPGGWIYTSYAGGNGPSVALSSCFVPYRTEVVDTPVPLGYANDIL